MKSLWVNTENHWTRRAAGYDRRHHCPGTLFGRRKVSLSVFLSWALKRFYKIEQAPAPCVISPYQIAKNCWILLCNCHQSKTNWKNPTSRKRKTNPSRDFTCCFCLRWVSGILSQDCFSGGWKSLVPEWLITATQATRFTPTPRSALVFCEEFSHSTFSFLLLADLRLSTWAISTSAFSTDVYSGLQVIYCIFVRLICSSQCIMHPWTFWILSWKYDKWVILCSEGVGIWKHFHSINYVVA